MLSISELAAVLEPSRTVLFLGAGAALSSGAPTGQGLADALTQRLAPDATDISGGLDEVASILELRYGRRDLIAALRQILEVLQPAGAVQTLPAYSWSAIYTTNYDFLVERAYAKSSRPLAVARSNFDYTIAERQPDATPYYKVHGCLSQDTVDGHQARMVLTESDYDEFETYREVLFKKLDLDLSSKDFVVIGHSLRDPHIKKYMDTAARLHRQKNAPGRLYAVFWERDEERALLMERKGYSIAFGSIEDLLHGVSSEHEPDDEISTGSELLLPPSLRTKTTEVSHALRLPSDVDRLFNGSPATYGDIEQDLTFPRECEVSAIQAFTQRDCLSVALTGTAGVGKTTLGRRILGFLSKNGYLAWEHNNNFPFLKADWLKVESDLRARGRFGVLMVDDCPPILSQLNQLLESLDALESSHLLVLVTAASPQWRPRTKSPVFFSRGEEFTLSRLSNPEINELLNLLDRKPSVRKLVAPVFASSSRQERFTLLRRRCGAEMYVCLKNVFATESLDSILLREYAELSVENQEMYRLVSAIEATGAQVHRQLILRLLGVESGLVSAMLQMLEGVVDEFDIKARDGIFGLSTRHRVIAQTITRYKYADEVDRMNLLRQIIEGLNPTIFLELRLVRELCDNDFGIGSLGVDADQISLYTKLIEVAPGERIPRHRLVGKLLRMGELDLAERELEQAVESVRLDPPLARYQVLLTLRRAESMQGIMAEDRYALMLRAYASAEKAIKRFPRDPYSRIVRGDVALAIAELTEDTKRLDDVIGDLEEAYAELREPNLQNALRRLRDSRRTFAGGS